MTIFLDDLKLMQSLVLSDDDDAGGRMSGIEVVDGVVNNLFPDISRLDRTFGRHSERKAFLFVDSTAESGDAPADTLLGGHTALTAPATDDGIHVTMFAAENHQDQREDCVARVEASALERDARIAVTLLEDRPAGSLSIRVRDDFGWIKAGEVFAMEVRSGDNEGKWQFIRVTEQIDDDQFAILAPLRWDFTLGVAETFFYTTRPSTSLLRDRQFFGIAPLAAQAFMDDNTLVVGNAFSPVAPLVVTNPDLVDIDPSGLPAHAQVPIFRVGDGIIVHHTQTTTLPNPVIAGSTYSVGRTDIAYAVVYDADGDKIPSGLYEVDRTAGNVTFDNPLDLTGYTQPLYVEHRIEDFTTITAMTPRTGTDTALAAGTGEVPVGPGGPLIGVTLRENVDNFDTVLVLNSSEYYTISTNLPSPVSSRITLTELGAAINYQLTVRWSVLVEGPPETFTPTPRTFDVPFPPTPGQPYTFSLGETVIGGVATVTYEQDMSRLIVNTTTEERYAVDLANGAVEFFDDPEGSVSAEWTRSAGITLTLASTLTRDYELGTGDETFVSTVFPAGDLQASYENLFTQAAWLDNWIDEAEGGGTAGQFDELNHPIRVSNRGTITERWRIQFLSVIAYRLIGETIGVVGESEIDQEFSPINPATGEPFMTIEADSMSTGFVAGNVVRFNTLGAQWPIWFLRCTLQGPEEEPNDQFRVQLRGDVNAE